MGLWDDAVDVASDIVDPGTAINGFLGEHDLPPVSPVPPTGLGTVVNAFHSDDYFAEEDAGRADLAGGQMPADGSAVAKEAFDGTEFHTAHAIHDAAEGNFGGAANQGIDAALDALPELAFHLGLD
jgi:hypothetical protein